MMEAMTSNIVNGIDTDAVKNMITSVAADTKKGQTHWQVMTNWKGGARCDTSVNECMIGGKRVSKDFMIRIDEPFELAGTNMYANPQEVLMAAFNSCIMITYVTLCALEGITLKDLRIETEGDIDLRGLFGLDSNVAAGYEQLSYKVHIKGNGTLEQFQKIHEMVCATSPNRFTIANPVQLNTMLIVE